MACGLILFAQVSFAQTSTQVFSAVDTRTSESAAAYATPDTFNTSTLSLTCNTSPITASLSGPLMNAGGTAPQLTAPPANALQPGGNLLVDNNLLVSVNGGTPTDICTTGYNQGSTYNGLPVPSNLSYNCFEIPYAAAIGYPAIPSPLNGDDPDTTLALGGTQTVDTVGGVAPIDISGMLLAGSDSVTIAEVDDGGVLTASSIFLTTNCTVNGVTGPATISGNSITGAGQTSGLTQTANFNTNTGQQVGFVYDVSGVSVFSANANGAIPQFMDAPLDPTTFQPDYAPGTSFATSNCLIHTGELLPPNNTPACKLYTLECTIGTGNNATGAQCPISEVANEVIKDVFDGPPFTLQNIYASDDIFHEGIGLLMASDTWSSTDGGPCTFDSASGLETLPCPLNLLTSFSGPGTFGGVGRTTNPNSTFISIYGVPEDLTSVYVAGEWPDHWVSSSTPKVYFSTEAPNFSHGAYVQSGNKLVPLPGAANYIPAPIQSITYGLSPVGDVPMPVNEPIAGDTILPSTAKCAAIPFTAKTVPNFVPPAQTLPSMPDGQYLLHYYAEDCAGTQELLFTEAPNTGNWSTNFYTYPVNIDTTPPVVTGLTLTTSAPYKVGSAVYATYTCTDATTGAGVVLCGTNIYGPQTIYNTGTLKTKVYTGSAGSQSFTVYAIDGAGNISSKSIGYSVTK